MIFLRINLSPDALEEFLSILRPSLFTPSSPVIRRFGSGPTAFPYDRSQPFKPRDASQNKRASISSVEGDLPAIESSPSPGFDHLSPEADQFSAKAWRMPGILGGYLFNLHTPRRRGLSHVSLRISCFSHTYSQPFLPPSLLRNLFAGSRRNPFVPYAPASPSVPVSNAQSRRNNGLILD